MVQESVNLHDMMSLVACAMFTLITIGMWEGNPAAGPGSSERICLSSAPTGIPSPAAKRLPYYQPQ